MPSPSQNYKKNISLSDICAITGLTRTTVWHFRKCGKFPEPIDPTVRPLAWSRSEFKRWLRKWSNGKQAVNQ